MKQFILSLMFVLILGAMSFILVAMLVSCETQHEPAPKPEPEKPVSYPDFEWQFKDADWLKESTNLDASIKMLRYIDERIYKLDRGEWRSSGLARNDMERAAYLNIRIQVLYHIYNLSKDVKWSVIE